MVGTAVSDDSGVEGVATGRTKILDVTVLPGVKYASNGILKFKKSLGEIKTIPFDCSVWLIHVISGNPGGKVALIALERP